MNVAGNPWDITLSEVAFTVTDALRASEGNRRARHQDGRFRFGDEECRGYEARRRAGRFAGAAF
jgi:hypothetical protein